MSCSMIWAAIRIIQNRCASRFVIKMLPLYETRRKQKKGSEFFCVCRASGESCRGEIKFHARLSKKSHLETGDPAVTLKECEKFAFPCQIDLLDEVESESMK